MYKRLLFNDIIRNSEHKNAIVVTGMRQIGKSTLLRQVYDYLKPGQAKLWFDFENPFEQKIFEDIDYQNIYYRLRQMSKAKEGQRLYIFIDEIQIYPEITKIIKYLIDHYQVKFFVTGSSSFYLKNLFPESLSGRKFLYELKPLSFKEYLYFKGKLSENKAKNVNYQDSFAEKDIFEYKNRELDYADYIKFGGFPEVATTPEPGLRKEILENIIKSFFEKDLKILSDYKDVRELRDLILLLVPRIGSLLDITRLAAELEVKRTKIYSYLEFLQGTFMIRLLPKYSESIDRSVAGGRKVYFSDNGLLNIIGNVNDAQLLENSVINQLMQYGELSFYNRRNIGEIDAVLNKKIALEIKIKGTNNDLKKTKRWADSLGLKKHYIISRNWSEIKNIICANQI